MADSLTCYIPALAVLIDQNYVFVTCFIEVLQISVLHLQMNIRWYNDSSV